MSLTATPLSASSVSAISRKFIPPARKF
jgi:hypothetical protein